VEYFNYLGSIITDNARCTRGINFRIAVLEAASNRKKALFTSKLDLNLRNILVKCYIWRRALSLSSSAPPPPSLSLLSPPLSSVGLQPDVGLGFLGP
jgi:hypothetical protein